MIGLLKHILNNHRNAAGKFNPLSVVNIIWCASEIDAYWCVQPSQMLPGYNNNDSYSLAFLTICMLSINKQNLALRAMWQF